MRYVPRGKPFHGTVAQMKRNATASETTHAATIARRVARAREAPDAAVEAERDEEDVAGDENRRQREVEDVPLLRTLVPSQPDEVRRRERRADQEKSTSTSTSRRGGRGARRRTSARGPRAGARSRSAR